MATSPYEWKILEWDEKPQTNKHSFAQAYLLNETVSQVSHVANGPLVFWCSKFFKSYWTLLLGTFASYFIFVQKNDAQGECQIPMEEEEDVKAGGGEGACRMIHLISILQHCCRISNKFTPHYSVVFSWPEVNASFSDPCHQSVSPSVCKLFSSPELKAHGSFVIKICPLSVVVVVVIAVINSSYFHLFLQNHWANFNQTWYKAALGAGDSSLFKWSAVSFS